MQIKQMIGDPGASYFVNGNSYQADGSGLINKFTNGSGSFTGIAQGDSVSLINSGCKIAVLKTRNQDFDIVAAASANATVTSVAAANSVLTIAAQPDVPRQLAAVLTPGAAAVTAGVLTVVYTDNDGVVTTDALSLITALSVSKTMTTTRGVTHVTSATITGFAGGSSPTIVIGTTAVLALPAEQGKAGLVVYKADMDSVDVALPTQSGPQNDFVTPATAPNGTHVYTMGYSFFS